MHTSPALYARGPYRVLVNAPGEPERLYVVVDTAGAWLHEEVTLDAACDWVDRRIAEREIDVPSLRPRRSRA
ncbi:hypothetical protein [Lysobacter claricitrinus]|uniref:hypothetical protein n=1 Tax=Lysobacter claricitrinus TaxID=3367728 RepID=UPI0037DBB9D1